MISLSKKTILPILVLFFICHSPLFAENDSEKEKEKPTPEKKQEEKNAAHDPEKIKLNVKNGEIPGFKVDIKKKEVRMEAEICLTSGLLEYLVCLPQTFEHEAIFVTEAKPQLLHAALLMIGREPTHIMKEQYGWWQAIKKNNKSHLNVDIEWKDKKGKKHSVPLEKFLLKRGVADNAAAKEKIAKDEWYFNGSFFYEGKYVATVDGSVVAVQTMASSVIQYGIQTGNPYEGDDYGFEINSKVCPPYGTKVEMVFTPKKVNMDAGEEKKESKKEDK